MTCHSISRPQRVVAELSPEDRAIADSDGTSAGRRSEPGNLLTTNLVLVREALRACAAGEALTDLELPAEGLPIVAPKSRKGPFSGSCPSKG